MGQLTMGAEDDKTIQFLKGLCQSKSRAVQSAALKGLGMAAKSTCDEEIRRLCLDAVSDPETNVAAIGALGMVFLGSGRSDLSDDLCTIEQHIRSIPVRGRRHCKSLAACYPAVGMVYLGTGSEDPLEFLLDAISRPSVSRWNEYRWAAAKALVMIEFPESAIQRPEDRSEMHGISWLWALGAIR
jgi:hypothetical protein